MRTYPSSTANRNVPRDSFLVAETSQMSGEIITTYYILRDGTMQSVTDWKDNKPTQVYLFNLCRLTLETEQEIARRWEQWKES